MRTTLLLAASITLISFNTMRSQVSAEENTNSDCLEMVMDEINKDLKFLIENPEGNDSAIYHLIRLRNRILAKMEIPEEHPPNHKQDSIIRSNINTSIQDQISELQKARERILKSSSETNPIIKNLDRQIEELQQSTKNNKL